MTVGLTEALPLVAPPVENPLPAHEVELVLDHVSVEDEPLVMEAGLAERDAVGVAALTVTVAEAGEL